MKDMEKQKLSLEVGKWYRNGAGNDVYIQNTTELERWPFEGIEYYRDELDDACWHASNTYSTEGLVVIDLDDVENSGNLLYEIEEPEWYKKQNESESVESSTERVFETGSKRDDDSNKLIRRFPSGAVRSSDIGRIRPDYISPYALEELSAHFTKAEKDFGGDNFGVNYFKGIKPEDIKGSLSRHYLDFQKGFYPYNKDIIREELRAIACNCIMALHQIRIEELGLYKEIYEKTEYIKSLKL